MFTREREAIPCRSKGTHTWRAVFLIAHTRLGGIALSVWSTVDTLSSATTTENAGLRAAIQKGTRVLISLWDSLMFGRVPKNGAAFLGTRPNISESHSKISTRVPFCIAATDLAAAGAHR